VNKCINCLNNRNPCLFAQGAVSSYVRFFGAATRPRAEGKRNQGTDLGKYRTVLFFPKIPDRLCGSRSLVSIGCRRKAAGTEVKNGWKNTSNSYALNACAFASYDAWCIQQGAYLPMRQAMRFYESSQNCKKRLLASSRLSVCLGIRPSAWKDSAPAGRIFIKRYECFSNIC
jgi:hypothetical protein